MRPHFQRIVAASLVVGALISAAAVAGTRQMLAVTPDTDIDEHAQQTADEGRRIFRFDTFGDESFWGGALKLHQAIEGSRVGGVGAGLSPRMALASG